MENAAVILDSDGWQGRCKELDGILISAPISYVQIYQDSQQGIAHFVQYIVNQLSSAQEIAKNLS